MMKETVEDDDDDDDELDELDDVDCEVTALLLLLLLSPTLLVIWEVEIVDEVPDVAMEVVVDLPEPDCVETGPFEIELETVLIRDVEIPEDDTPLLGETLPEVLTEPVGTLAELIDVPVPLGVVIDVLMPLDPPLSESVVEV